MFIIVTVVTIGCIVRKHGQYFPCHGKLNLLHLSSLWFTGHVTLFKVDLLLVLTSVAVRPTFYFYFLYKVLCDYRGILFQDMV